MHIPNTVSAVHYALVRFETHIKKYSNASIPEKVVKLFFGVNEQISCLRLDFNRYLDSIVDMTLHIHPVDIKHIVSVSRFPYFTPIEFRKCSWFLCHTDIIEFLKTNQSSPFFLCQRDIPLGVMTQKGRMIAMENLDALLSQ